MGVVKIPSTWHAMQQYQYEYEKSGYVGSSVESKSVAESLIGQFVNRWFPQLLHQQGRWLVIVLLEDYINDVLRLKRPLIMFNQSIWSSIKLFIKANYKTLPNPRNVFSFSMIIFPKS